MKSICLSGMSKKDILSVIIVDNGKLVVRRVEKIMDKSVADSTYLSLIHTFTVGLVLLKMYLEEHSDIDTVVFECNNSAFIKWVKQGYSRDEYHSEFMNMLQLLDNIPIQYSFSYSTKPQATMFVDKKYIEKEKLSSLID